MYARWRYHCERCKIIVVLPGLCEDCAAGEAWIVYCRGEDDERYWQRRNVRFVDPEQTERQERLAENQRESQRRLRAKRRKERA